MVEKAKSKKELIQESEDLRRRLSALSPGSIEQDAHFLQSLIDAIPNPIFYKDAHGVYRGCNTAFAALVLGLPKERIIGSTVYDLPEAIPPELADVYHDKDMALIREPGVQVYEAPVKFADGTQHHVVFNKATLHDVDGLVIGMVGAILDVTELKRMEAEGEARLQQTQAALAESEALYHLSSSVISFEDLPGLLQTVVDNVARLLPANRVSLISFDLENRMVTHFKRGGPGFSEIVATVEFDELWGGLSGWVLRELKPALSPKDVPDPRESPAVQQRRRETNCGAIIVVPLLYRGRLLGTMTAINRPDEADFSQKDVDLMMAMANQGAAAIENARLFQELQRRSEETALVNRVVSAVASSLDVHSTLDILATELVSALSLGHVGIALLDEARTTLTVVADRPVGPDGSSGIGIVSQVEGNPLNQQILATGQPVIVPDAQTNPLAAPIHDVMRQRGTQTLMILPLIAENEVIGTVDLDILEAGRTFTPDETRLVETIMTQASAAIRNARLYDQTRTALAAQERLLSESEALYRTSRLINAASNVGQVLSAALEYVRSLHLDRCLVVLLDNPDAAPSDRQVEVRAVWDQQGQEAAHLGNRFTPAHIPFVGTLGPGDRMVVADFATAAHVDERTRATFQHLGVGAAAILPLAVGNRLLGWLLAETVKRPRVFEDREVEQLHAIAGQAAVAIQNLRLLEETRSRAIRLQTAAEVSRAASSILDPDELIQQVVDLVRERFDLYYAGLFLVDQTGEWTGEPGKWAVLRAGTGEAGRQMIAAGHKLEIGGESMIGWCMARAQARIALDVGQEAVRFSNPHLPQTRSELALPLISRGQIVGAMTIQSEQAAAFSSEDLIVLQTMADQVATAIANAHLFAEAQIRLDELLRTQRRYALDMWDAFAGQRNFLGYTYDLNRLSPLEPSEVESAPPGLPAGQSVVLDGDGGDQGRVLLSPLEVRREPVGFLEFEEPTATRVWSEDEVAVMDAVRDQISLALENRLLLDQSQNALRETRRREAEVRFLQEVAAFLNATDDVVVSQRELLGQLQTFLPVDSLLMAGYDLRTGDLHFLGEQTENTIGDLELAALELQQGTGFAWVVAQDAPLMDDDVRQNVRFSEDTKLVAAGLVSRAMLPLKLGYRTLGVLYLGSRQAAAFSRSDLLPILQQVAAQVASAMERANLLRQTQASASESRTLYEAISALAQATSYDTILRAIVQHTVLSESARAEIGLYVADPETGAKYDWLETVAAFSSEPAIAPAEIGLRLRVSELPALALVGSAALFICEDVASDPRVAPAPRDFCLQRGIRSIIIAPLIASGEKIGILQVHFSEPYHPSEQDTRLYRTASEQAAVVLSNRQLLQLSQNRAEQLGAAVDMANLVTSISEREVLLQKSVDFFKERFGLYFAGIFLLDEENEWAVLQSGTGELGKKLLQMGHRLQVGGDSMVGWCVVNAQRRVSLDVTQEPLYFENPLLPDTKSAIALPLISRGQVIGTITVQSDRRFAFTQEVIATLELMANQLANVIESTNLYERSQSSLAETRALYRIAQQITDARTVEDVLQAAVEGIAQRAEPDWVSVGLLEPRENPTELRIAVSWSREGAPMPTETYPLDKMRRLYDVLRADQRFITPDIAQDPFVDDFVRELYGGLKLRAMAAFQLEVRGAQYGTIMIHNRKAREFSNAELRFYENVARQAFVALESLNLLQTTQNEADRRAILNEVLQTASSILDPSVLMQEVSRVIAIRMAMPVMLWRWDGQFVSPVSVCDAGGRVVVSAEDAPLFLPSEVPFVREILDTQSPVYTSFHDENRILLPKFASRFQHPLEEGYGVPLIARGTVMGMLALARQEGHEPIDDHEKEFIRTAGINISVALDTARLYHEAQETAEQLKEVDKLKSQFMANMSHELRTPLNSIIGFSRVILKGIDGPLTEMQRTDLTAIYESGEHLLALINDILDISKIEAGKMELILEPTDLTAIVKSVMSAATAVVRDKPVELQTDIPMDLPVVSADPRRVRQVLTNIVGNAGKFTEQGYIRVGATFDNFQVIFSVEDTGIGIPEDRVAAVFERFEQVDSSSTRRYGGTGLGMSLSREFVRLHGGDMWVESTLGIGSTFYFSLPIDGPSAVREQEQVEGAEAVLAAAANVHTVLAIDDDEGVITLFRRYLEKQGYRVFGLTDGSRAVEEARRLKPYAITLDILLPGKDGWQVIQDLRSDPETHSIPIVVCSILGDADKGLSMGVADYLMKPIMEQDLLDALLRLERPQDEGHVLVVDDNPDDRKLLRRILEDAGYNVEEVSGGAEAIAAIVTEPPSLVILDLMMPGMDGFAVLENLKSNQKTRHIPVVVVTAKELTPDERERLQQRVEALLQKGLFDQNQLLNDITVALNRLETSLNSSNAR